MYEGAVARFIAHMDDKGFNIRKTALVVLGIRTVSLASWLTFLLFVATAVNPVATVIITLYVIAKCLSEISRLTAILKEIDKQLGSE